MCQLGAVVFSRKRVWRKDGLRSHSDELVPEFKKLFPREKVYCAEMDFETCEWGMANGDTVLIPDWATAMLNNFAYEQWGIRNGRGDAEKLLNFVMHAGAPEENALLLSSLAEKAYAEATAPAWKAYTEATAPAWKAYTEATALAWCSVFAINENRIAIWKD